MYLFVTCVCVLSLIMTLPGVKCQMDDLYYDVQEETAPIVVIANLSRDSNVSSQLSSTELPSLRYQLYSGTYSTKFRLNNLTGILTLVTLVDREVLCRLQINCVIRLNIGIQSLEPGSSFFHTLTVHVNILDINDNAPIFPQASEELSISESSPTGTSYAIDRASDLDTGTNNSVHSYALVPESPVFGIRTRRTLDGGIGVSLVVMASLDRETTSQYDLNIVAYDNGNPRKSGQITLHINVSDANDNKPQFSNTVYNVSVNETCATNVTFASVLATDIDTGVNGQVTYRFSVRQTDYIGVSYFSINEQNGEIYPTKSLTQLQGRTVRIIVEAKDSGVDSKVSQCIVHVLVLDNANNPPTIRLNLVSSNNTVTIGEDASVGSLVAYFITIDDDSDENGDVSCFIFNSSDFSVRRIKNNQYKIILGRKLDREIQAVYHLNLVCQDGGHPSLQSEIDLYILLIDHNDNAPVFNHSRFYLNITENNISGLRLATVHATDKDIGENGYVTYRLGHMTTTGTLIQVNRTTGDVIVFGSFDYEIEKQVNISIIAVDGGMPSLSATATLFLTVTDVNDNPPYFEDPVYIFNIKENLASGQFLGRLHGRDEDDGDNGRLNYMLEQNSSLPFLISKDGDLTTTESFDRETQASYTFRVIAYDIGESPKYGSVDVTVFILDENDHIPRITYPNAKNNTVSVSYHTIPGTELLQIEAVDDDEGDNARILFRLQSQDNTDFCIIDQNSGTIFLNRQLTFKNIGELNLIVKVFDRGIDPMSSSVNFTIHITDGYLSIPTIKKASEQNMLVVIALVSVTLVIAIVVLSTVLLLKRTDKQKHLTSRTQYDMKDNSESVLRKGIEVKDRNEELRKYDMELKGKEFHGPQPTNEELIVFKMKLAEKYQVAGGDSSFSKETEMSDVLSSVSGETTGCDSGRGASEGEGQDDGITSVPNSPRKQFMTFTGPVKNPTYYRLNEIKTVKPSHKQSRQSINLTDSYKMKSNVENKNTTQGDHCEKFKTNNTNSTEKFRPKSDNYDSRKEYLKNVSDNYQYLDVHKPEHDNQYCQYNNMSYNKQSEIIFDRDLNTRFSNQQHRNHEPSPRNKDIIKQHSVQETEIEYLNRRNMGVVASSLRNSVIYTRDSTDVDGYSVDTMDDGHSTTTSGSYTVDNEQYTEEFYNDSRYVTHLNHNPEDVFV